MSSPKENEIQQRIFENIAALLGIPDAAFEPARVPPAALDFQGTLSLRGNRVPVVGAVKSVGEPWAIRSAIQRLVEHRDGHPEYLPLLVSESIGPHGRALCKRYGIAYLDLLGNCYLEWGDLYIDKVRASAGSRPPKRAKSLFSDKASLVIRSALEAPGQPQQVRTLSTQLGISPAWVSQVLRRLISGGYAAKVKEGVILSRPLDLLNDWAESHNFARRNELRPFFSPVANPQQLIARLGSQSTGEVPRYALTLHAGASLVAPFAEYHEVHLYVDPSQPREETERVWQEALALQPVDTGGNVYLIWPYYKEGAFYGSRQIDGVWVVSDVQLYVDLYNYPVRGREQAEYLLRHRLAHLGSQR
jgi:hypothetical protein